ncbi:MAG TPA: nitrilase-related carbon-nitrogen hydrolase [Gaiellaceae bacterium]
MLALLAQLESALRNPHANAARAAEAVAAHPDADIAVFPELFLSAYDLRALDETARPAGCEELNVVAEAAERAGTAVVIGFAERNTDGSFSNSVACIDRDGTTAGVYRKAQLFAGERKVFRAGRELCIVRLAGVAVAPLICFDIEFPELPRALAVHGAELFVTASANMEPFAPDHELATRARALENRLPHLYANATGSIGRLDFVGLSRSVGPAGEVLAEAGAGESLLLAPVGVVGALDESLDYLGQLPGQLSVVAL